VVSRKTDRNHDLEAIEIIQTSALELVNAGFYDEASIAFIKNKRYVENSASLDLRCKRTSGFNRLHLSGY
jgi:hypothetical protein